MISVESPIPSPSISSAGTVWCFPRVTRKVTSGGKPPGGQRRLCGIRVWSSAQRAFSL